MEVVGGSAGDPLRGTSVFLSNNPAPERHHLAIFQRPELAHTAFRVDSLAGLRERYRRVNARGIPIKRVTNSGASFAFVFDDPDGTLIEVYWPTGRECRQAYAAPLDLTLPEAALLREAERFPLLAGGHGKGADEGEGGIGFVVARRSAWRDLPNSMDTTVNSARRSTSLTPQIPTLNKSSPSGPVESSSFLCDIMSTAAARHHCSHGSFPCRTAR